MKVFTRDYRITGDYPEPFAGYFGSLNGCVLDIETTGLDPARSKVILTGMLTRTDSGVRVTQFLAENHYEENRVLDATMDFLANEKADYLITYNGQSFDVPFLNSRLSRLNTDCSIRMYDFDLYRFLKKSTDLKNRIGSLSQKSVEHYFGIADERNDIISGRESVAMYEEFALTGNSTLEKIILTHNREDVLHLHRLMYYSIGEAEDFDCAIAAHGFPVCGGRFSCRPHISARMNRLIINGDQFTDPVSAAFFPDIDDPLYAEFKSLSSSYEIGAPLRRLGNEFYLDLAPLGIDALDDPDCVNGYLILNPRTVNLLSRIITERVAERI